MAAVARTGCQQRQDHCEEELDRPAAVDDRSLVELPGNGLDEAVDQEYRERDLGRRVEDDDPQLGVDQVSGLHHLREREEVDGQGDTHDQEEVDEAPDGERYRASTNAAIAAASVPIAVDARA